MKSRVFHGVFFLVLTLAFTQLAGGAVVFRPGEKAKYVVPGEEEISGNAVELFHIGQAAEKRSNLKRALKAYRTLVRRYPRDAIAPGALFRQAELEEQTRDYLVAAQTFRSVVQRYLASPQFNEAIEGKFRIGEMYLAGIRVKILGLEYESRLVRG